MNRSNKYITFEGWSLELIDLKLKYKEWQGDTDDINHYKLLRAYIKGLAEGKKEDIEFEIKFLRWELRGNSKNHDMKFVLAELLFEQTEFLEGCEVLASGIKTLKEKIESNSPEYEFMIYDLEKITYAFYHMMGFGYHNMKKYNTAIKYYTLAIDGDYDGSRNNVNLYYYDRSQSYLEKGNLLLAINDLKWARDFASEYELSKKEEKELLEEVEKALNAISTD